MTSEVVTPSFTGALCDQVFHFGVQAHGLDGSWCGAECRAATLAAAGEQVVDVVAGFGLVGKRIEVGVGQFTS